MRSTITPTSVSERNQQFGRLLSQASRLVSNRVNLAFRQAGYDITVEQWTILADLMKEDGLSQQVFADRSAKNKASITSLVNNLEKKGWVTRNQNRQDRRSKRIFITKDGKKVHVKLAPVLESTLEEVFAGLTDNDFTGTMGILNTLIQTLQPDIEEDDMIGARD